MSSNNETKWVKHILLKYNKYVTWCGRLSFYQVWTQYNIWWPDSIIIEKNLALDRKGSCHRPSKLLPKQLQISHEKSKRLHFTPTNSQSDTSVSGHWALTSDNSPPGEDNFLQRRERVQYYAWVTCVGIIQLKIERMRIQFLSDVFIAFTVLGS